MASTSDALSLFTEAAIEWAGGGRGQPLVDAAAQALADGLDSPTLRLLAGAVHGTADEEERRDLAPTTFEELGIDVNERMSADAVVESARLEAKRFLDSGGGSPSDLARELWRKYVESGYDDALYQWSGFDDWYDMLERGVFQGRIEDADAATLEAARALVERRPPEPALGQWSTEQPRKPSTLRRLLRRARS